MTHFDLEEELAAAMHDRTRQEAPHTYDVDTVVTTVRRRRRRLQWATAAAVAAVTLGAGFVAQTGSGRVAAPPQTSTAPSVPERPTKPPTHVEPTRSTDPAQTLHSLYLAALRHQNPATRAAVDPAAVAALFADRAAYERIWGTDSLGVTCGERADGVLASGEVSLYRGSERVGRSARLDFDAATGRVRDVTCTPVAGHGKGGDPAMAGFYGGLVAAGSGGGEARRAQLAQEFLTDELRSGQGATAGTCSSRAPKFWLADNPSSATLTHGWTVTLDDGRGFPVEIDEDGKIARSCGG
ncbi:hypothetical protein H9Y04_04810 [Streptomyces sp. TRM66268-LWL]|uniref:Uncharacterized protein n=1 Tax=Streptomyces polyasparticus TaxID=2767826 RepID=A0ABR7S8U8_9ACTN|nr:hypothetical protein [Streptomyces polyasparticus]MBC9711890.1 hypothetical protein [Streptomyces polyasparticus]